MRKTLVKAGLRTHTPVHFMHRVEGRASSWLAGVGFINMHATAMQLRSALPGAIFSDYRKVGVVRNPWDRCVSLYRYHQYSEKIRDMTFEKYLQHRGNDIKQAQYFADEDGNLLLDGVIRFENLNEDLLRFAETVGMKKLAGQLSHINPSRRESDYHHYYENNNARRMVEEISARDIELFGYEF